MANRFIGGVLSSQQPSSGGFVSRASTGTYFNNTGTLVTAPINQPRLNYSYDGTSWKNPAVLLESASTNLWTYSIDFAQGVYTKNNVTIAASATAAPDGTLTATAVTETATTGFHEIFPASGNTSIIGAPYTFSAFVKPVGRTVVSLYFSDGGDVYQNFDLSTTTGSVTTQGGSGLVINSSIIPVGNGWFRCSTTRIAVTTSLRPTIEVNSYSTYLGNAGQVSMLIWGLQHEQRYGPSSYIPTTGSTATRAQDDVGPLGSGIYTLAQLENQTAIDDQSTVQTFTAVGSTTWTAPADVTSIEVLVVAGGGGANNSASGNSTGGGGGGGVVYNTSYPVVPGTTYPIIVGQGGAPAASNSVNPLNGSNSQFANLVAIGGGFGAARDPNTTGGSGGSGGGGNTYASAGGRNIAGQGYSGGNGLNFSSGVSGGGGGGGGAAGPGGNAVVQAGGVNGPGLGLTISGTLVYYGAGGVGQSTGGSNTTAIAGGTASNTNGAANTGAGGAGGTTNNGTSIGGSGIVVIKYKRTPRQLVATSNAAVVVQRFTTTNTWTVPAGVTQVEALVVAGGGGAGNGTAGGGGGAGGVTYSSALTVTPGATYTIGVGAGGISATDAAAAQAQNGFGSGIGTGAELITNGSGFTTTTGWTATTATLSVPQTGTFRILPNASVNGSASQTITTAIGTTYVVLVKVTSDAAKFFRVFVGSSQFGQQNATFFTAYTQDSLDNGATGAGFYSTTFTATATTTWIDLQIGGGTQQPTDISYISVRQASLPTVGGGSGGSESATVGWRNGGNGGSGGGTVYNGVTAGAGTGTQGNAGGIGYASVANLWTGGGGGGAASAGGNASTYYPGYGGAGVGYAITGNLEYYGGGGGGSSQLNTSGTVYPGLGGIGGGGTGFADQTSSTVGPGQNGAPNTGGGGGAQANQTGSGGLGKGNGGSGVVILRYRVPTVAVFQDSGSWTCPAGVTTVQALVVAGGGGGGPPGGGGGGAGGLVYSSSISVTPGQTYPIVLGQGGDGGVYNASPGSKGGNSGFAGVIALGGGAGGGNAITPQTGGSGGGQSGNQTAVVSTGTYGQGNAGGTGTNSPTYQTNGGGGGAGGAGGSGNGSTACGAGGAGLAFSISGATVTYAGGGGGSGGSGASVAGAAGGSGGGGWGGTGTTNNPTPGLINTGGGGGGRGNGSDPGAHGGSGIVIIRYYGG